MLPQTVKDDPKFVNPMTVSVIAMATNTVVAMVTLPGAGGSGSPQPDARSLREVTRPPAGPCYTNRPRT